MQNGSFDNSKVLISLIVFKIKVHITTRALVIIMPDRSKRSNFIQLFEIIEAKNIREFDLAYPYQLEQQAITNASKNDK